MTTEDDAGLDPDLADEIADIEAMGVPPWHALSVESARRVEDELFSTDETIPVGGTTDLAIDGSGDAGGGGSADGGHQIPLRIYRPEETPAPTLVFFHGGGWCLGTLDSADGICRRLCNRVGAVVISVDYRLAPENPFPAAVEDALTAVRWADEWSHTVGGDGQVGVAGTSAGGGIAAAVGVAAARSDDDDGAARTASDAASGPHSDPLGVDSVPDLAVQGLFYPATAPRFDTESYRAHADGPLLTQTDMRWFWDQYLASPTDSANPYAAPLWADSLVGAPPAVVAVGSHDPLRDDGLAYADRLSDHGVSVSATEFDGLAHGFLSFAGEDGVVAADEAFDQVAAAVRRRFD
ncbi:MAG: alpha/beta hydrolase [Halobaculum sp.]